jgi:hypothetical protein
MIRKAFVLQLHSGQAEECIDRHSPVWSWLSLLSNLEAVESVGVIIIWLHLFPLGLIPRSFVSDVGSARSSSGH